MDVLTSYNSVLQVAAAFIIFVVGYLAVLFAIVLCLVAAEGLRQAFNFARISLVKSATSGAEHEHNPVSITPVPALARSSAFFGWTHRLTGSLAGLRHR